MNSSHDVDDQPGLDASIVMVVEDEFFIRLDIADGFRRAGYKVVECGSADEAVELLQAGINIDALFTDVRMPGAMNGWTLALWIVEQYPGLPVLITSGEPPPAPLFTPFFPKPYQHGDVIDAVRRSLGTS